MRSDSIPSGRILGGLVVAAALLFTGGALYPDRAQAVEPTTYDTTTTLGSDSSPGRIGEKVTLTATVASDGDGPPAGDVTFMEGTTALGTVSVRQVGDDTSAADLTMTFSDTGKHTFTAEYAGDSDYNPSTSPDFVQMVLKGGTKSAVKLTPRKPKAGTTVRVVVRIAAVAPAAGTPGGKVVAIDDGKRLGKFKVRKGKAKFRIRRVTVGRHKLKVRYLGTARWKRNTKIKFFRVRK